VIWDFDGTLAFRTGNWRGCMIEVLDAHHPGHGVDMDALSPLIHNRFPWDNAELEHHHLSQPDAWWEPMENALAEAFAATGHDSQRARWLAARTRARFVDHSVSWGVFDDSFDVLDQLSDAGWCHVVLSNHVPELPALVAGLGFGSRFMAVLTSAAIGYEKPHPEAFAIARAAAGDPAELWMVGDNPVADVAGATAVGIPAIQVRTPGGVGPLAVVPSIVSARSGGGR
jgi:putative hydrolase of the HAD superfamily